MIQELYQTLKQTQPQLFTKLSQTDKTSTDDQASSTTETDTRDNENEEEIVVDEEEEEEELVEEIIPLTPEMEQANTFFHQANRLINVTFNRQYET